MGTSKSVCHTTILDSGLGPLVKAPIHYQTQSYDCITQSYDYNFLPDCTNNNNDNDHNNNNSKTKSWGTMRLQKEAKYDNHHLSLNREGRWGTTDDFTTSFLHFSLSLGHHR